MSYRILAFWRFSFLAFHMDHRELLKRIRRIHIRTMHMADDVFAGQYHSAFKGQGMEFEEVREYQPGDEIRSIDWNVTARQGRPFIKRFREERELTVMLVVDVSGSQFFGSREQLKRELAAEIGATLAFSAIKNNDKVGLIGFSDRIERYIKPDKGTRHVLWVIRELLAMEPAGRGTDVAAALDYMNKVVRRRSVVFVVSDFLSEPFERSLRAARRRHDVIPIVIGDERERVLPRTRLVELMDNETGHWLAIDASSRGFREAVRERAEASAAQRRELFRRLRTDCIELETGESITEPLTRFFRAREARL
jgi:uncharacterized protein (DUF58 family)